MQKVQICNGKSCQERFCKYITMRLENDTKHFGWDIEIEQSPCMDQCKKGPNIKIKNQVYNFMNPAKSSDLVLKNLIEKTPEKKSEKKSKKPNSQEKKHENI